MKKNISIIFAFLIVFLVGTSTLRAEEGQAQKERGPKVEREVGQGFKTFKMEMKEDQAKLKEERKEGSVEWRYHKRGLIMRAFLLRVSHLENIADRIDHRIDLLEEKNIEVEDAQKYLSDARKSIDAAKVLAEKAKKAVEEKDDFETIKGFVLSTKEALKEAHKNLSLSVQELKSQSEDDSDNDDDN